MASNQIYCKFSKKIRDNEEKRVYRTAYHVLINDRQVDFTDLNDNIEFVFARVNGKLVGIIEFHSFAGIYVITMVYVLTKFRKLGVMRKMFKHLLRRNVSLKWTSSHDGMLPYKKIGALQRDPDGMSFTMEKKDFVDKK